MQIKIYKCCRCKARYKGIGQGILVLVEIRSRGIAAALRQLGEVVSIITTKLIEAIDELQGTVNQLQTQVNGMDSRINALKTSGVAVSAGAAPAESGEPIATMAKAPAAAPPPAAGGGGSMMGELKQLLAARRKKADG